MEYRARGQFEWLSWALLNGLMWVGAAGIAWRLLKPGGWLYQGLDLIVQNQPVSFYYLGTGTLGLIAGKIWLDNIDPRATRYALTACCAFAGTLFIMSMVLPL